MITNNLLTRLIESISAEHPDAPSPEIRTHEDNGLMIYEDRRIAVLVLGKSKAGAVALVTPYRQDYRLITLSRANLYGVAVRKAAAYVAGALCGETQAPESYQPHSDSSVVNTPARRRGKVLK